MLKKSLIALLFLAVFLFTLTNASATWGNSSFNNCRNITIDHTKIASDLTNFPVYVKVDNSTGNFTGIQVDWDDIRFYNASCNNGGSQMVYEITNYTSAVAYFWVRFNLSSSVDDVFSVYYNNTTIGNEQAPTTVWSNGYYGVWHLDEGSGTSTRNSLGGVNGTLINTPIWVTGTVGNGVNFTSTSSQKILLNDTCNLGTNGWAIEVWQNKSFAGASTWEVAMWSNRAGSGNGMSFSWRGGSDTTNNRRIIQDNGGNGLTWFGVEKVPENSYRYVVETYDGTNINAYLNNTIDNTSASVTITWGTSPRNATIASSGDSGTQYFFGGAIDEVILSNTTRSTAWINASYYNGMNQLITWSAETTNADTTAPIVTISSPTNTTYSVNSAWVNLTLNEAGSWCGRSLDGTTNVTMSNTTGNWNNQITSIDDGAHNVRVFCNDTTGNMNESTSNVVYFTTDTTVPTITFVSPANTTLSSGVVSINVTLNVAGSYCQDSLDGGTNSSMTNSSGTWHNQVSASDNPHNIQVFCNNTLNNWGNNIQYFTVDTTPPTVTISSPTNTTYTVNSIWVNVTLNEAGSWCGRSLDEASNTTLTNSTGKWHNQITSIDDGVHNIKIYCNDSQNNMGSATQYFTETITPVLEWSYYNPSSNSFFNPYTNFTFNACRPFGPCSTSNSTASPSLRVLYPSPTIALKCTNTSSAPLRVMNPKPLALLNHFTVPEQ